MPYQMSDYVQAAEAIFEKTQLACAYGQNIHSTLRYVHSDFNQKEIKAFILSSISLLRHLKI